MSTWRKVCCCLFAAVAAVGAFGATYYVTPTGGGDGSSWADATTIADALAAAAANGGEVWLKEGVYALAATTTYTLSAPVSVRGGFAGTEGDPADRKEGTISTLDGNGTFQTLVVVNDNGRDLEVERVCFYRSIQNGLRKTKAGNLTLTDCDFIENGTNATANTSGKAIYFDASGARLTAIRCRFLRNRQEVRTKSNASIDSAVNLVNGLGATFGDCLFFGNCTPLCQIDKISGYPIGDKHKPGSAILSSIPIEVTGSTFAANITLCRSSNEQSGGTVWLQSNAAGSVFRRCAFYGNNDRAGNGSGATYGGAIVLYSNLGATPVTIDSCTFAYNLTDGAKCAAGITAGSGNLVMSNCVFGGNRVSSASTDKACDLNLKSGVTCHVSNTVFGDTPEKSVYAHPFATFSDDGGLVYGDPLFVTRPEDLAPVITTDSNGRILLNISNPSATYAAVEAIDFHLLSSAGYVKNDAPGTWLAADVYSPAIDAARGDWANEPTPNGATRNAGFYGNTAEASKSEVAAPSLTADGVTVAFAADTKPTVTATLGGAGVYNATVLIQIAETDPNGGDFAGWTESKTLSGIQNGAGLTLSGNGLYQPGSKLYVRVTVDSPGLTQPVVVDKNETVTGELPFYYNHGGGPGVIHVREGASAKKDGSDWENAFDSLDAALALAAADETKTNIWVAGTIVPQTAPSSRAIASAKMSIRGGFRGNEDSAAERAEGAKSTLDGNDQFALLEFSNANPVFIERLVFTRSGASGVKKTGGAGDVTVADCVFQDNVNDNSGEGCYFTGTAAATISVTNCLFANNRANGNQTSPAGRAIYAKTLKRIFIDECLFTTNGSRLTVAALGSQDGKNGCSGGVLYANGAPMTVRNCAFRANRSPIRGATGGLVWIEGASAPTAFTNCVFTGGQNTFGESDVYKPGSNYTPNGGVFVINLKNAADVCELVQCTVAYNLTDAYQVPGCAAVIKGTLRARNTIFYKNVWGPMTSYPHEIYLHADGYADLDYVWVTDKATSLGAADPTHYTNGTLYDGDPGFVTPTATFEGLIKKAETSGYTYQWLDQSAAGCAGQLALDVHLLSPKGYWKNDGSYAEDAETVSEAIDKGDPDTPVGREPDPNGGRVNLGYCGGTERASKTSVATPVVNEVTVDCPNGHTQPRAIISMGATSPTDIYSATVTVECYLKSDPGERFTTVYPNVGNGTVITNWVPWCYQNGDDVQIDVKVTAPGVSDITVTSDLTVTGEVDPSFQKGGGADVIHVRAGATGLNNGSDWFHAYTDIRSAFQSLGAKREIWIARTGAVRCPDMVLVNAATLEAIRGGFAGVEETADARDGLGRTVFDAQTEDANAFRLSNGTDLELDGLEFANARERGLYKTGDGGITLVDCAFRNNGAKLSTQYERGSGAYLTGSSSASAVIANCQFEGNVMRSGTANDNNFGFGGALCVTTFNSLELVGTHFLTNGVAPEAGTSSGTLGRDGFKGSAVYVKGVPVTMRDCEFRGNRGTCREGERGGCVRLEGACGGSVIDHCLWLGNYELTGWNNRCDSACTGALVINLSAPESTVTVRNSTIAYNLSGYYTAAAGISVAKGTLNLEDSIVFGNRLASGATVGSDLALTTSDGFANVSYTLFTSNDTAWVTGGETALVKGDGIKYGDPLLVTDYTNAMAKVKSWSFDAMRYDAAKLDEVVGFDAHLRSKAGYRTNGGAFVEGDTVTSPAIDAGNPLSDYDLEPSPNGLCVNMGRYGNTTNASLSVVGQPEIASVVAECVGDYTQPRVTVTLGAESADVDYKATVEVIISTNGVEVVRGSESGIANGGSFVFSPVAYLAEGATYDVSVRVTAVEAEDRQDEKKDVPVTGRYPEWIGHGGGAGVLHVWTGAPGNCSGSDWHNACHAWNEVVAVYAATQDIREIWFIDIAKGVANAAKLTAKGDLTLRGGFANTNDSIDERVAGAKSVLDGFNIYEFIKVENETGRKLSVERLVFCNSSDRGFIKTGGGDVEFEDCDFLNNYKDRGAIANGRGLHVTGAAGVTRATLRRCTFEGNGLFKGGDYLLGYGAGAYFANCARVTVDDSLFRTNGVSLVTGSSANFGGDCSQGSAIYATSAPLTVLNTKFVSNHGVCRKNTLNSGGTVRLEGACGGSAFTNCLFVGNSDRCGWDKEQGFHGGAIVLTMSDAAAAAEFVNCTIAYNLADGKTSPGGINVYKGTVNLKNSIVFGNVAGGYTTGCGREVDVKEGAFNAEDCLFADLTTNTVQAQAGGTTNFVRCITGDPLFVTPFTNVTAKITNYGKANAYWYFAANEWNKPVLGDATRTYLTTLNVHLRGGTGYTDETTGEKVTAYRRKGSSPAIDAGDPASDCSNEASPNGNRVNLGFYGNTPYATRTSNVGTLLIVR